MEPEAVATSPNRIKSPVPVCCGFGSVKWCSRQVLAHSHHCTCTSDALNVVSLLLDYASAAKWIFGIVGGVALKSHCAACGKIGILRNGSNDNNRPKVNPGRGSREDTIKL